jgi:hypothetical protein
VQVAPPVVDPPVVDPPVVDPPVVDPPVVVGAVHTLTSLQIKPAQQSRLPFRADWQGPAPAFQQQPPSGKVPAPTLQPPVVPPVELLPPVVVAPPLELVPLVEDDVAPPVAVDELLPTEVVDPVELEAVVVPPDVLVPVGVEFEQAQTTSPVRQRKDPSVGFMAFSRFGPTLDSTAMTSDLRPTVRQPPDTASAVCRRCAIEDPEPRPCQRRPRSGTPSVRFVALMVGVAQW